MSADNGYDILCDPSINMGDKDIFTQVYLQAFRQIKNKVKRYISNEGEAEEVVQETFLKVLKGQFDHRSPPIYWLSKIASRAALDRIRDKKKSADNNAASIDEDPALLNRAPTYSQDNHVLQTNYLERILKELSSEDQKLLNMKHIQEKSYEEISAETGITVNTVKIKIFRAIQKANGVALRLNPSNGPEENCKTRTPPCANPAIGKNVETVNPPSLSYFRKALQLRAEGKSEGDIPLTLHVTTGTAQKYVTRGLRHEGYKKGKKNKIVFDLSLLTRREAEVVRLKDGEGKSFEEIGKSLNITTRSARNHMGHAYRKGYVSPLKPPELSDREYQFARLMIQGVSCNDIATTLETTPANVRARLIDARRKFPDMKSLKAAIERKTKEISQNSSPVRKAEGDIRLSHGTLAAAL